MNDNLEKRNSGAEEFNLLVIEKTIPILTGIFSILNFPMIKSLK